MKCRTFDGCGSNTGSAKCKSDGNERRVSDGKDNGMGRSRIGEDTGIVRFRSPWAFGCLTFGADVVEEVTACDAVCEADEDDAAEAEEEDSPALPDRATVLLVKWRATPARDDDDEATLWYS